MVLLQEGLDAGASIKAVANLFGICSRTLKRWDIALNAHGFSVDSRKGSLRYVVHKFSTEERRRVIETVNDPRFADLTPAQIVPVTHASPGLFQRWKQGAFIKFWPGISPFYLGQ